MEEEIFVGVTLGVGKCTRRYVTSVEKTVKFLLGQVEINQYIVVIVLKGRKVEVQEDQVEKALEDLILEKEIIQTNSYWRLFLYELRSI